MWRVEAFRLSAFFQDAHQSDSSNWWDIVVHEPPEVRNIQPKVKVQQEEGNYAGGRLILNAQPLRADWLFIPAFDPQVGGPDLDQAPAYNGTLIPFDKVAERWLLASPPLSRLAFGAVLNVPVKSVSDGYRKLGGYLPAVTLDSDNSRDFLYQINRSRRSTRVDGLTINRLSKWAVATAIFGQVPLTLPLQEHFTSQSFWAHLELDINTAPEYQAHLSPVQWRAIFSELVELATEVTIKGDIP